MIPIILKELKQRRISLIAYTAAALAFLWLYVSLFPYLQQQSQAYAKMFETFPKAFMDAFGFESSFFLSLQGYIASEMYSLIWPLMLIFLLISNAGTSIAGEVEKLTISSLIAQPISRARLFLSKYLSGVINLVIFVLLTILPIIPLAKIYKLQYTTSHFFTFTLLAILFGLSIYSFAFMFSSIYSEKSHVYFTTGGVLFGMYVLNIISGLKPGLSNFKYASVFHYFIPGEALIRNHLSLLSVGVFGVSTIVFSLIGLVVFSRRDISI